MTIPHLTRCSWIKGNRAFYIPDGETALVLYLEAPIFDFAGAEKKPLPKMTTPADWHLLYHQTSGYMCAHRHIYAKFLQPRKKFVPLIAELSAKYLGSCISEMPDLTTAVAYNQILEGFGIGANQSYTTLQEAFYPIDIEFVRKISSTTLPKDLDDLVVTPKKKGRLDFIFRRKHWQLAILGENCD